jgi:hypothetical protein
MSWETSHASYTFHLPMDLMDRVDRLAIKKKISRAEVIRRCTHIALMAFTDPNVDIIRHGTKHYTFDGWVENGNDTLAKKVVL